MSQLSKLVAKVIGEVAMENTGAVETRVMGAIARGGLPDTEALEAIQAITPEVVQRTAERVLEQDPALRSKRVWALLLPALSTAAYALLDPSIIAAFVEWLRDHPGAWWGVSANVVALLLPLLSRMLDPRPVRGQG